MRSMWSGTITFGMVSVPVKLYKATDKDPGSGLNLLCKEHMQPITKKNRCSVNDQVLTTYDVVHAAHRPEGWVVIDENDMQNLPLKTMHSIDIEAFVPKAQVPMRLYANAIYWLEPNDPKKLGSGKPYAILLGALQKEGVYGIGKIGMRDKEQLVAISSHENAILLTAMTWPDRVRKTAELNLPTAATEQEVGLARQIIENLREDWDATKYRDAYGPALEKLIDSKAKGLPIVLPQTPPKPVPDIMEQLKASIAATTKKTRKRKTA